MLNSYLYRLYDTVVSRGYIEVEQLVFDNRSNRRGSIKGRLNFYDGSLLDFGEVLIYRNTQIEKLRYTIITRTHPVKRFFVTITPHITPTFRLIHTINMPILLSNQLKLLT